MSQVNRFDLIEYSNRARLNLLFADNVPAWVELTDDSARKGSIGQAVPFGKKPGEPFNYHASGHASYYGPRKVDVWYEGKDKPTTVDLAKKQMVYLQNYTGPSVVVFKRNENGPKRHDPLDLMGKPITLGCMVIYTNRASVLRFGKVEKISESGKSIFIRTIDIDNAEYTRAPTYTFRNDGLLQLNTRTQYAQAERCEQVTVIRSDLLTDLMMVKLQIK